MVMSFEQDFLTALKDEAHLGDEIGPTALDKLTSLAAESNERKQQLADLLNSESLLEVFCNFPVTAQYFASVASKLGLDLSKQTRRIHELLRRSNVSVDVKIEILYLLRDLNQLPSHRELARFQEIRNFHADAWLRFVEPVVTPEELSQQYINAIQDRVLNVKSLTALLPQMKKALGPLFVATLRQCMDRLSSLEKRPFADEVDRIYDIGLSKTLDAIEVRKSGPNLNNVSRLISSVRQEREQRQNLVAPEEIREEA